MEKKNIPYLSATELSRLIASREVSPVEATEAYLERIDALDFKFNAYLNVCREGALRAAREAEQAVLRGNRLGPMHGIPVAVKDQLWTAGVRTTGGTPIMADFLPTEDATAVAYLKSAGAVLLGKTNLTEFALAPSIRYSHPRNPWDLDMSTGPSSGGSGAATATYLCSTSLGEDTSGSIRFPSAWWGSSRSGVASAAMASCAASGRWTPPAPWPEQYPWLGVKVFVKLRSRYLYAGRATQGVCRRASAFNCNSSLRITATKAKFPGFPR